MFTGSVITGNSVTGAIVCGPAPGMLKEMMSRPEVMAALALRIACRIEPAPLSFVFKTMNVNDGIVLTAARQGENSDVLPFGSVAVAVRYRPVIGAAWTTLKLAVTLP